MMGKKGMAIMNGCVKLHNRMNDIVELIPFEYGCSVSFNSVMSLSPVLNKCKSVQIIVRMICSKSKLISSQTRRRHDCTGKLKIY